jgi:mannose-6-phosphate isomerase-like protein (cupin superfamily)
VPSPIRRVVTGKDAAGKAVVLTDSIASNVRARKETGAAATFLWLTDSSPADISQRAGIEAQPAGILPPPKGTIFRVVEFAPEKDIDADYETRLRHTRQLGLAPEGPTRERPRDPGMHRTRTLDYAVILSGEIDMLLDDSEVHLKAGDVVIQQGTNHAWVNRGDRPCQVAFILIDAKD